ncbi:ABC-F family ATP-binding cassette domain-containing protein [Lewinella cohaerens]|uniref:ABC-F family ATP-binding cassette domain-containing protein n=1 Tax=Lewinella cohaerens TaxID=70995 RepID=UPI00036D00C1|nr:ABC-F family ATP-binding cassette domain-containing protein [Lewinella cohaerens]
MITLSDIYVQYGNRILLDRVTLVIGDKDKIGLVGRNGAGKSTLLKIIAGYQRSDEGTLSIPSDRTIGFLHQEMNIPQGKSVMEETLSAFAEVRKIEARLAEINKEMAVRTDYETDSYLKMLEDFSTLNDRFLFLGGDRMQAQAEMVLKGLGFAQGDFIRLTDEFSGGWKMRIELAKMLLAQPDYLLLDEPTNHLDIESIIWLEDFLQTYPGSVVVISHDKQFLDNVTKRTVEVELGKLYDYKAHYSKYIELREERREKLGSAYANQQKVIAQREKTINRFMAKATKTKLAQSMQKQLDKMERVEIDEADTKAMVLRFPPAPRSGTVVVDGKGISKKYGKLKVLDNISLKLDRGDRVAFVGQNGQGKTTLAKILIDEIPATGGDIKLGHNVSIGYYAQNQSEALKGDLTLLETLENSSPPEMRTKLRSVLGAFLFSGEDVDKKVSVLSGGERARLALAALLLRPFNLLVLDEPTNHLDIISKDVLKQALIEYDGTLIVVSHDREFLADLTDRTIEFRDHHLHNHLGDINFFLEKRQMANMREVELSKSNNTGLAEEATASGQPKVELSYEERKKLTRALSNAEKKVERLENDIEKLETLMSDPDFYSQSDAQDKIALHQKKKDELTVAMEEWEEAQMNMDEAEN